MNFFKPLLFVLFISSMVSCSKDDDNPSEIPDETYSTEVYLTDAPIDNAEVQGVFVTVAEVQVNGKALEGFQKTTVELSSLTEGKTELLGEVDLEAGNTSSIVLVLDSAADASGEAPGNYVLTVDGEKKVLASASNTITLSDNAEIFASDANKLILDFDLRKSVVQNAEGEYSFAGESRLSNSIRAVNEAETGTITGQVTGETTAETEAVVVFAYEAGAFTESEAEADFSSAVNSSLVSQTNGEFSLHYIEEGSYDLIFASYADEDNDGNLELQAHTSLEVSGLLDLTGLAVEAGSTLDLDITLDALLSL